MSCDDHNLNDIQDFLPAKVYHFGPYTLDARRDQRQILRNKKPLRRRLDPQEYSVLTYLISVRPKVVLKERFPQWGAPAPMQRPPVVPCISSIRNKLGKKESARFIRTDRHFGYHFDGELIEDPVASESTKEAAAETLKKGVSLWTAGWLVAALEACLQARRQFQAANDHAAELTTCLAVCSQIEDILELQDFFRQDRELSTTSPYANLTDSSRFIEMLSGEIQRAEQLGAPADFICTFKGVLSDFKGEQAETMRWCSEALTSPALYPKQERTALLLLLKTYLDLDRRQEIYVLQGRIEKFCTHAGAEHVFAEYVFDVLLWWYVSRSAIGDDTSVESGALFAVGRKALETQQASALLLFLKSYHAAGVLIKRKQAHAALRLHRFATELSEITGNTHGTVVCLLKTGLLLKNQKDFEGAEAALSQANETITKSPSQISAASGLTARVNLDLGRVILLRSEKLASDPAAYLTEIQRALQHLQVSQKASESGQCDLFDTGDKGELYLLLAAGWMTLNKFDLALEFARKASVPGAADELVDYKRLLLETTILQSRGDLDQTIKNLDKLRTAAEKLHPTLVEEVEMFKVTNEAVYKPFVEWIRSPEARNLQSRAGKINVRTAVAEEMAPLVDLWNTFSTTDERLIADALDFWGRGGFARVAAAIRTAPHNVASVSAYSVSQVRELCNILLPLFDVVIVLWRGPLTRRTALVPIRAPEDNETYVGGHFYRFQCVRFPIAANLLAYAEADVIPDELALFIKREAFDLIRCGRLIVVPSALVLRPAGRLFGMTHEFFSNHVLGGCINVISSQTEVQGRIFDLQKNTIPYMRSDDLSGFNPILDEVSEWLHPLRSKIFHLLNQEHGWEEWTKVSMLDSEIRDAFVQYEEKLKVLLKKHPDWVIKHETVFSSVTESNSATVLKSLLPMIAQPSSRQGSWIPFWRLKAAGGALDWTRTDSVVHPFDAPVSTTWLHPGNWGGKGFVRHLRKHAGEALTAMDGLNNRELALEFLERLRYMNDTYPGVLEMMQEAADEASRQMRQRDQGSDNSAT